MISISVVIPLYNKGPHIASVLDSVLGQTVKLAEIIVVDDGSTDGSADIVVSYQSRGVQLIQQQNRGVSAARNRGIEACSSKWIALLDADDIWLPNHIEVLVQGILKFPEVGLISTRHVICENGGLLTPAFPYATGAFTKVDDFYRRFAVGLSLVNSSTACVRREAVRSVGGFPEQTHFGEDIILWIQLFERYGMAHNGHVTSIIQRDAVNRSIARTAIKLDALEFMGDLLTRSTILADRKKSICVLFDRIAVFTAAGRKLQGDLETVKAIRIACWRYQRTLAWLIVSIVMLAPAALLKGARSWRQHAGASVR